MVSLNRILCAIDFSDFSLDALRQALVLARWYSAQLTLFHVYQPSEALPVDGIQGSVPVFVAADPDNVAQQVREFCAPVLGSSGPDAEIVVKRPDVLIVEGLNVLQPPASGRLAVSDLFDFTIYVDARTSDIEKWYVERFLRLQRGAFADPSSYFHRYAALSEAEAVARARGIWNEINGPNLARNILPTRARASLVLRKGSDHTVSTVLLRKV